MNTLKRRMEQLLNGRFEYRVPELILSEQEITVKTKAGENHRGELLIGTKDNRRIKGMVMSSHRRILLAKDKFSGTTICIPYGIDVKGLSPGEVIEGEIIINSNLGEYQIPVRTEVGEREVVTSKGTVGSLDEFAALAQADYREAYRLFASENFLRVLTGADKKWECLYLGMSQKPVPYQNMEEFLIASGKKEPVTIQLEKNEKTWDGIAGTFKDTLTIQKKNWGYTRIEVEVQGRFLEVEKKVITSDDFIGSIFHLEYLVRKERLGKGKQYGKIILKTPYTTLCYQVIASGKTEYEINTHLYEKKAAIGIARAYHQFLLHEISKEEWKEQTLGQLEELRDFGIYSKKQQIIESFVYDVLGDIPKASSALWTLREMRFAKFEMEEEAMYLVLALKLHVATEKQKAKAVERVRTLHRMEPGSRIILNALMELDEEYQGANHKKLYKMENLYDLGCNSPFLYLDAYEILMREPGHLKKLSPFYVQVLTYAAKHGKLTRELADRVGHLSGYVKEFQEMLYRLLVSCYESFPGKNLLECICKYIVKGQPGKKEYFPWYELAVEEKIRITGLYEFFIETMPESYTSVLPQVIRMYFVYNNTLGNRKKAMVYANVICNKEVDRYTYQSYKSSMETFALEALKAGRMNEDYAVIYQECIEHVTQTWVGEALGKAIFTYRLYCDDPKIRKVIVCHPQLEGEETYIVNDGVAYIRLYAKEAEILFEDEQQRRYHDTVEYNIQKLMDESKYVSQCIGLDVQVPGLLLHICSITQQEEFKVRYLDCYQHVVEMPVFREKYRNTICGKILEYYGSHAASDTLDRYLRKMDYMTFARVDKVLWTEILIDRGMYEKAFEIINEYGYEGIRIELLVLLASRMIIRTEFIEQEELVYLAEYVFQHGKYDDVILTYLSDNLLGSVESMTELWKRMRGFQLDTYELEEEILLLSMFGRCYLKEGHEILQHYMDQKGKEQIVAAYLCFWSYHYFLGQETMDESLFRHLETYMLRQVELDLICRLALIKRYSQLKEFTATQEMLLTDILHACNEQGLRFGFYQDFPVKYTKPYQMDDKQFVEVQFPVESKVMIYYAIDEADGNRGTYRCEPVRNMYQGIFVKEFLLFYGEKMRYYLVAETPEGTVTTEESTMELRDDFQVGTSQYQLLNQMLAGEKLQMDQQVEEAMEQYLMRARMAEKLFPLIV